MNNTTHTFHAGLPVASAAVHPIFKNAFIVRFAAVPLRASNDSAYVKS